MRAPRWAGLEQPLPARPYRNSAIFYFVLAVVIVLAALVTGGSVGRAALVALAFFVVATGYSWWRWRARAERQAREGSGR